jgi:hypothetical protein
MIIDDRNRLRSDANLPLLSVEAEAARLAAVREQAAFDRRWDLRRPDLCHEWTGDRDGWMANMGRWSRARQQVRDELHSK